MEINDGDSLKYQAEITGYDLNNQDYPKLDSISFKLKYKQINTNTVIEKIIPKKQKIFTIRPEITGGYDIVNQRFGIVVGVGVGINL